MRKSKQEVRVDKPLGPEKVSLANIPWRSFSSTGNFPRRLGRPPKITIDDVDFREVRQVPASRLYQPFLLLKFSVSQGFLTKRISLFANGSGETTFFVTPAFDADTEVKRPLNSQDRAALRTLFEALGEDDYASKINFGDESRYYDRFDVIKEQEARGYSVREQLEENLDRVRSMLKEVHNSIVKQKAGMNAMHGEVLVFDRLPGTHYYGSSRAFKAIERVIARVQSI